MRDSKTLIEILRNRARERPEMEVYTFLADGEGESASLRCGELALAVQRVASELDQRGLRRERVLLLYPPGLDFVVAFLGCLAAGVVPVPTPLPRRRRGANERLRSIVDDCRPAALLTLEGLARRWRGLESEIPGLASAAWLATDAPVASAGSEWPRAPEPSDIAFLQYTSGSTAEPRGVVVRHRHLAANEAAIGRAFGTSESSVIVSWLPVHHDMGMIGGVLHPLYAGARCVMMAPTAFLQRPARWLEAISRYRATVSGGPDFAYDLCVRKVGEEELQTLDLSCWRVAFDGAEPVCAGTLARFADRFADLGFDRRAFFPCYGLAEATLFVSGGPAAEEPTVRAFDAAELEANRAWPDEFGRRLVGCGRPSVAGRVVVVDPESRTPLPERRVGEVWFAGDGVADGYWGRPEASAEVFEAFLAGAGGGEADSAGAGPFLRTGDLGFLDGGELFLCGRLKDLIIVRGRNIHPHDLEATSAAAHPAVVVGAVAAFAVPREGEERVVIVHEVARRPSAPYGEVAAAVRERLAADHEVAVHEVVLARVGTVPKTSSGKVRRRHCRELYLTGRLRTVFRERRPAAEAPPAGERWDAEAWRRLAPAERAAALDDEVRRRLARAAGHDPGWLDPDAPLVRWLADSLAVVELAHGLVTELGVRLEPAELLDGLTVTELREVVAEQLANDGPEPELTASVGPDVGEPTEPGFSHGQRALWFLERLAPDAGVYNLAVAARVGAGLDRAALGRAWRALLDRHPVLELAFPEVDGEPTSRSPASSRRRNGGEGSIAEVAVAEEVTGRRLQEEARRPFDLERGPLWRAVLFRDDGSRGGVLLFAVHHLVCDFWSLTIWLRELGEFYTRARRGELLELPSPAASYAEWVAAERRTLAGAEGKRLQGYWQRALDEAPTVLELPTDRPRPARRSFRGRALRGRLGVVARERVASLARRRCTTSLAVLLTTFEALLYRWSGAGELLVGVPSANREARFAGTVGYFVNPLVVRSAAADDPSFEALLGRTWEGLRGALAHGALPFPLLVEEVAAERDSGRSPLFQAMFVYQRPPTSDPRLAELAAFAQGEPGTRVVLDELELGSRRLEPWASAFDLTLETAPVGDELSLLLTVAADLFDDTTGRRLLRGYRRLLEGALAEPGRVLSELPLLSRGERHQLLQEWSPREFLPPRALLHASFEARAARHPDAVAVVDRGQALSYGELAARARRLARLLASAGVAPEVPVGVHVERTAEMVVAVLGVLTAGGVYLPLDPAYPEPRRRAMLEDADARVVVTGGATALAGEVLGMRELSITDPRLGVPGGGGGTPVPSPVRPGNLAYLIYTSGSTGRPKGVAIEHRAAARLVAWAGEAFTDRELEAVLASTSICFDLSVFELFATLSRGGTVVVVRHLLDLADPEPGPWHRVRLVNTVPSALAALLDAARLPVSVATVGLAGEALLGSLVERVWGSGTVRRLLNLYGPTEATTYTTWAAVPEGTEGPAIGRPLAGDGAHLANHRCQPVPVGTPGELLVAGAGLARGYLGRPTVTAERFVPHPWSRYPGARLYRTGDLARRSVSGELFYLGRIDRQIKVRGFRIEPGEVERSLIGHPAVTAAAVVASGGRLVAFAVAGRLVAELGDGAAGEVLRGHLEGLLPSFMVPSGWHFLERLPHTPSGKVDRGALERAVSTSEVSSSLAAAVPAPRGRAEEVVAGLFAEFLELPSVGRHTDFFVAGGHSLLGVRLLSRLRGKLGAALPLAALFEDPTPARLAARTERGIAVRPPLEPGVDEEGGTAPLAPAQERLYFLHRLEPESPTYHLAGALRLRGDLDRRGLAVALGWIARRHAPLRTTFEDGANGPRQRIHRPRDRSLPVVELAGLPTPARRRAASAVAAAWTRRPFALDREPPWRALLLALGGDDHELVLVIHHLAADGPSLDLLAGELAALYPAFVAGDPPLLPASPVVSYVDFARWHRRWLDGGVLEEQLAYWRRRLAGLEPLALPADRPGGDGGGAARVAVALPTPLVAALSKVAGGRGVTRFMAVAALFAELLGRLSGRREVVFGVPVSGRSEPPLEGLIGCFVNTVSLRLDLAGEPSFTELLGRSRETLLGAFEHGDVPYERVVEEVRRGRDDPPPVSVLLAIDEHLPAPRSFAGVELVPREVELPAAKFDWTVSLGERDGALVGWWEYRRDRLDRTTVRRAADRLRRLASAAVADPERPLEELGALSPGERHQLVVEWAVGLPPAPSAAVEERVAAFATRHPDVVAVRRDDRQLSYGALLGWSGRLASAVRERTGGGETVVGVAIEPSAAYAAASLAVLRGGAVYLPLDPTQPAGRLAGMLADAGAVAVFARGAVAAELAASGIEVLPVAAPEAAVAPMARRRRSAADLAYVIYTSGSTGRPKGVAVPRGGLARLVSWHHRAFGTRPGMATTLLASPGFDASVWELWTALAGGATLHVPPPGAVASPGEVYRWVVRWRLDHLFLPTPVAEAALAEEPPETLTLHRLFAGGDQLRRRPRPGLPFELSNLYGPSEGTVITVAGRVPPSSVPPSLVRLGPPTIGRPIDGTEARVVDRRGRPVATGVAGELWLGGAGLARGYVDQPALTAVRFMPSPSSVASAGERCYRTGDLVRWRADGEVEFLGRADRQVKMRGVRVEPGEVEAALAAHPGVTAAVVAVRADPAGEERLVAWVVGAAGEGPPAAELREHMATRLPAVMVPSVVTPVPELPLTSRGKVDRLALPAPHWGVASASGWAAPRGPVEDLLAAIWGELLGRQEVAADDDFFDLGGHSLLAARMAARVREAVGVEVPLRTVFAAPTVAALAAEVTALRGAGEPPPEPPLEPLPPDTEVPLSPAQRRLWLHDRLAPGSAAYSLPATLELGGRLEVPALAAAFTAVAARHEPLRTAFPDAAGRPRAEVLPPSPFSLPRVDLTALADPRRRLEAVRLERRWASRGFDLARGPLARALLLRLGGAEHRLFWNVHHAVFDGWSVGVLVRDLAAYYRAAVEERPPLLPPLQVRYADYAARELRRLEDSHFATELDAARRRLGGVPEPLELPTDRPRPATQGFRGGLRRLRLGDGFVGRLADFARRRGVTPFMLHLAAFQTLLFRLSGNPRITVGTPVANREPPALEALVGLFVNVVVLPADLSGDPTLAAFLEQVRERVLDADAQRRVPFEALVEALEPERDPSRNPLFQALFAFQNTPRRKLELPGLELAAAAAETGAARFDIALSLGDDPAEPGALVGELEVDRDLFDATTAARWCGQFETLLGAIAEGPERCLSALPAVTRGERHQLLAEWGRPPRLLDGSVVEVPGTTPDEVPGTGSRLLHQRIAASAERHPHRVALWQRRRAVTYGELAAQARRLAARLRRLGVGRETRVGIALDRGPEVVIAMWAVLEAGGAWVPLEPTLPAARLERLVNTSGVRAVIADGEPGWLPAGVSAVAPDEDGGTGDEIVDGEGGTVAAGDRSLEELAYVIYTSGSTGEPKGVMVSHGAVSSFCAAMDARFGRVPATWLAVTGIAFDISILELLWTLQRGDTLVVQEELIAEAPAVEGSSAAGGVDFSLFYFAAASAVATGAGGDGYRLLLEGARAADRLGFRAVWTPERHFHPFGGPYPNPAVTGAAVAAVTERVEIRAGSVVLPLHNPLRVAEEWSVVDNLSGGRVGVSVASGWHVDDFALAPDKYRDRHEVFKESIDTVRRLWRGEKVRTVNGRGNPVELGVYPPPVCPELPMWMTAAGNPATFELAGRLGMNLLTHLLTQSPEELEGKIASYRRAWRDHGHSGEGKVSLMLHTFLDDDMDAALERALGPFRDYLRSSFNLLQPLMAETGIAADEELASEEVETLLDLAVERFRGRRALLGTPESCRPLVERFATLGVDEIGCLIDFGVETDAVLRSLEVLARLARSCRDIVTTASAAARRAAADPMERSVAAQICHHRVTHLQCTPSTARLLVADAATRRALGRLELLLLGGEALPAELAAELGGDGPDRVPEILAPEIYNMYGPTETTIWSTSHRVTPGAGTVPVGRPDANASARLVDGAFRPVAAGVPGELLIGGPGVARGYLGQPALTAGRFVPDPWPETPGARLYRTGDLARWSAVGELLFLGRRDHQLKLGGHRIEPGEIEATLRAHPAVAEAVVVPRGSGTAARLVAWIVPAMVPDTSSGTHTLPATVAERAEIFARHPAFRLPDGAEIAHLGDFQTSIGYREVFVDQVYRRHGITLEDGDVIFDVGANVGLFSLWVHRQCRPERVYAFEPIPPTFEVLRANVALHGLRVEPLPWALGERSGRVPFTFYPNMAGLSSRHADVVADRAFTRSLIRDRLGEGGGGAPGVREEDLEEFLDQHFEARSFECELRTFSEVVDRFGVERIDLLKVDVERAELEVLAGIRDEDWRRVRQLVLEVDGRDHLKALRPMLEERGYQVVAEDFVSAAGEGEAPPTEVFLVFARRPETETKSGRRRDHAPAGIAAPTTAPNAAELRAFLGERLPPYMVPGTFAVVDRLPTTPNRKVDRKALELRDPAAAPSAPSPLSAAAAGEGGAPPRTEMERLVAGVWREVLGLAELGVDDNFFEVGGSSLLLAEVHGRLQEALGRELPLLDVFRHPTVSDLARHLVAGTAASGPALESVQERGRRQGEAAQRAPTVERQRRFLAARTGRRPPAGRRDRPRGNRK